MDAQEVFNTSATHLMKQGEQASDGKYTVMRDDRGRKCAVGVFIPDSEWTDAMGCYSIGVARLIDLWTTPRAKEVLAHHALLHELLWVHGDPVSEWPRLLREVAAKHGLTVPESVAAAS